ncbi:unnamed protein product [Meloidogyne enterolobii]|uniref:Uncharacterized protein n=1 Tax=Meloidogyne enterolobii TaxID=390850 RepID=A0ACB0Z5W8_MELEN
MFSMAKLRRCSPLFSCSLLFVAALLLFGGLVQCAKVGAGKHELDGNGKISKLGSNMVVVKEGADLSALRNLPEACHDVEWDGKEWIKILYKKDGAAKEGCVLDLVAEEKPELKVYIGVKFSNNKCLKGYHNMLPFTYSLGGGQFEKLKDGKNQARRGESGDCGHERQCLDNNGYCLKVADFMVGFGRDREYIMPMLTLVDEPNILFSTLDGKKVYDKRSYKETFKINMGFADNFGFTLNIDNDNKEWSTKIGDYCLDDNQGDPFCFNKKHLRTIKHWEITDESHTDKQFKYLFTFYLLPQKAARSGGDIKTSNNKRCNIYSRRLEDEMLDGPNCDYLFIKLVRLNC